jgi:hypothetical protein
LSQYITKSKYILKMIQIIVKLDEMLIHILSMSSLYDFNYNCKFWLMRFQKKHLNNFFIQVNEHKCVQIIQFVEKLPSFERWQELSSKPLYQHPFYMFIKMLDENFKKYPQNIANYTKKEVDFLV